MIALQIVRFVFGTGTNVNSKNETLESATSSQHRFDTELFGTLDPLQ